MKEYKHIKFHEGNITWTGKEGFSIHDTKKECGICTGLIFSVLCPSCKLCSKYLLRESVCKNDDMK